MPPLDDETTLHIRCGSDIRETLAAAGRIGAFHELADPFCQGPVRQLPMDAFIEERSAFIARAYGLPLDEALARQRRAYDGLRGIGQHGRVVLWLEHDSFDQLILAFLLAHLASTRPQAALELICVDRVPGVERFIGLGQLAPEQLAMLWATERRPLTQAHMDLGTRVWNAVRDPDPRRLLAIAEAGTQPVPLMARALLRHLQELPWTTDDLGLTQRLVLEILAEQGPITAGRLFGLLMQDKEPLPYLGDLMLWHVLDDMMLTAEPIMRVQPSSAGEPWPRRILDITELGRQLLAGDQRFLPLYQGERWVGGACIAACAPCPRWDEAARSIVAQ